MKVTQLAIPEVKLFEPRRFGDDRGYFAEIYSQRLFAEAGVDSVFVQQNLSLSRHRGTLRGLHYQRPPFAQAKLVRVSRGRIWDVAVDIRKDSATYGHSVGAELSADNFRQLFVPAGFLHGFVTIEDDTEVVYQVDAFYSQPHDGAVRFDDPDLAIDWRGPQGDIDLSALTLSDKDRAAPLLRDIDNPF